MGKAKTGMPYPHRYAELQVLENHAWMEPEKYAGFKVRGSFTGQMAERAFVRREIAAKTNTTAFVSDAELRLDCEAGDPWLEHALRGVAVTVRGCVEVLAYMHSLAHVVSTLRIYRKGRGVTKECHAIAMALVPVTGPLHPEVISKFVWYHAKSSLKVRSYIAVGRDSVFTTLYRSWGSANDPQQLSGRPEPSVVAVRKALTSVDWLAAKQYTLGEITDADQRRGVERVVVDFLWRTGYLPRHLAVEYGLTHNAPISDSRSGRPRKGAA